MKEENKTQSSKTVNKGFTLIELLVVIIIIGILAAIALPKYQLAADKTKFARLQSTAKDIAGAYTRYHLATNDYPYDIRQLDIDFSEEYTITNTVDKVSCIIFTDYYCCLFKASLKNHYGEVLCGVSDYYFAYVHRLFLDDGSPSNHKDCRAKADNSRAVRLCKSFSDKQQAIGKNDLRTPYGVEFGYTAYSTGN